MSLGENKNKELKKKIAVVHIHNGILCSSKKEGNSYLSMDGTGDYYAKWNKPVNGRWIWYDFTYNWNLMDTVNEQAK